MIGVQVSPGCDNPLPLCFLSYFWFQTFILKMSLCSDKMYCCWLAVGQIILIGSPVYVLLKQTSALARSSSETVKLALRATVDIMDVNIMLIFVNPLDSPHWPVSCRTSCQFNQWCVNQVATIPLPSLSSSRKYVLLHV